MSGTLETVIPESSRGARLDQALAALFPEYSRSRIQQWIHAGRVAVDGRKLRPRDLVAGGERVSLAVPAAAPAAHAAQPIGLAVVHEDEALLVIDKPAGLVVHPGAGNPDHTLLNALLHHAPELAQVPRAGLIHRLDKETSGLLLVARTLPAHTALTRALAARAIDREYQALCVGRVIGGGTVDAPLGRHPADRIRRAVRADGRPARTTYRVLERFRGHSHLRVQLDTGRTHQIRVHLAHVGHPLVGDPVYGRRRAPLREAAPALNAALAAFRRQALHAARLAFPHPSRAERLEFAVPPPADFAALLTELRADAAARRA
jgi:23S rRNA pseudouridine1911/1915/1917 synthase